MIDPHNDLTDAIRELIAATNPPPADPSITLQHLAPHIDTRPLAASIRRALATHYRHTTQTTTNTTTEHVADGRAKRNHFIAQQIDRQIDTKMTTKTITGEHT